MLTKVLIKRFHHHQVRIVNLTTIVKAFIALTLFIHVVTCGWILISISNPESWLFTKGLITEIDLDYGPQNWEGENGFDGYLLNEFGESQTQIKPLIANIYFTCFYFTTTAMTAVGYGDIKGWTQNERLYLIAVAFSSLYLVSFIRSSVLNLMGQQRLTDIIRNTKFQVESYMLRVDKAIENRHIESEYYDKITDYVLR